MGHFMRKTVLLCVDNIDNDQPVKSCSRLSAIVVHCLDPDNVQRLKPFAMVINATITNG